MPILLPAKSNSIHCNLANIIIMALIIYGQRIFVMLLNTDCLMEVDLKTIPDRKKNPVKKKGSKIQRYRSGTFNVCDSTTQYMHKPLTISIHVTLIFLVVYYVITLA